MRDKLAKLIDVKSLVTLALTAGMLCLLLGPFNPSQEVVTLFSTAFGSVVTYFFTRKEG